MTSLPYRFPWLYDIGIKILLRKTLSARYERIAQMIGKKKTVLDLGCGTGMLFYYLDSCEYMGWDLNDSFVEHCQKRGLNVHKKDIFHFPEYPECDFIVLCDILHHVIPRDELLVREAAKRARVIAAEPCSKRTLPKKLVFVYDQIIGDADGINSYENRIKWNFTATTLTQKFLRLGASEVGYLNGYVIASFQNLQHR